MGSLFLYVHRLKTSDIVWSKKKFTLIQNICCGFLLCSTPSA